MDFEGCPASMLKPHGLYLVWVSSDPASSWCWSLPTHWLVQHIICQHVHVCISHTHTNTSTQEIVRSGVSEESGKCWSNHCRRLGQTITLIWSCLHISDAFNPCLPMLITPWSTLIPFFSLLSSFPQTFHMMFVQSQYCLFHSKILFPFAYLPPQKTVYKPSGRNPSYVCMAFQSFSESFWWILQTMAQSVSFKGNSADSLCSHIHWLGFLGSSTHNCSFDHC